MTYDFSIAGSDPSIVNFWSSVDLRLKMENDDYFVYLASNVTAVQEMHNEQTVSFKFHLTRGLPS